MSTRSSPVEKLAAQAKEIARVIKKAERGEPIDKVFAERIAEARKRGSFKVGVVMDDVLLKFDLPWDEVGKNTEEQLAAFILVHMQGLVAQ